MNMVAIYGTEHRGSTYNITQLFIEKLKTENSSITEFFMPKDMPHFCLSCFTCFTDKGERYCPHYNEVAKIKEAMIKADFLIFASPVFVYHTTGQMKALLDHFGYQWMAHRPEESMFHKAALVISTAAGAGMKSANKDITDSLTFWGVGRIFTYGKRVAAVNWEGVSEKIKTSIYKDVDKLSSRILKASYNVKPQLKVKAIFYMMRFMHKKFGFNQVDVDYWEKKGWLKGTRPW